MKNVQGTSTVCTYHELTASCYPPPLPPPTPPLTVVSSILRGLSNFDAVVRFVNGPCHFRDTWKNFSPIDKLFPTKLKKRKIYK